MRLRAFLAAALVAAGCASYPQLHEADFARVTAGMTPEEVRRAIGEPTEVLQFPRQRQVSWDYAFTDLWGYQATTSILFESGGRVIGKVNTRKEPEDN
jgi:outer membrane protein assembly factor BamE (lipoprotein component of BamABCDE complex)